MHDFEPTLREVLAEHQPRSILEWGPGLSTQIMRELCPDASITSIEHDRRWIGDGATYVPIPNGPSEYDAWPLIHRPNEQYDLIFIDGRRRAACLLTALMVLADDGVVVLHDCKRPQYRHAIDLFETVICNGKTVILRKPSE